MNNNVYNPNAMNIRSSVPTVNPLLQPQLAYNNGLNENLYNNNNGYYNNLPNNEFFKCRPVSSKTEASAYSIDLNGSLWIFVDLGHNKIYTKQVKENGQSEFKVYAETAEQEQTSSEYVTKTEFNSVIQSLAAAIGINKMQETPANVENKTAPLNNF